MVTDPLIAQLAIDLPTALPVIALLTAHLETDLLIAQQVIAPLTSPLATVQLTDLQVIAPIAPQARDPLIALENSAKALLIDVLQDHQAQLQDRAVIPLLAAAHQVPDLHTPQEARAPHTQGIEAEPQDLLVPLDHPELDPSLRVRHSQAAPVRRARRGRRQPLKTTKIFAHRKK